jgi:hypothetical protein
MQSPAGAEVSASDARAFVENCMAIVTDLSSELDKTDKVETRAQIVDCRNHLAGEIEPQQSIHGRRPRGIISTTDASDRT